VFLSSCTEATPNAGRTFPGGLDVHVGHLLTVRVFNEALGLSHSGAGA
jgi:hypothetical protein